MHDKDDSIHDEYPTSEDENITEIETYEHYGRKCMKQKSQNLQKLLKFLLYSTKQYIDSSDDKTVIEIELPKENREQEIGKQDKLLTTKFQIEIEKSKAEGLIIYSFEQQIFEFKVNSGNNQELWGVNADFT